ncbi:pre-toxin TG domain-containing protein [Paenibacillus sp. PsM32]|uniref:pre-toxin TG domain-containing protein n=1 Tax=Paenibacillus sp. PsM32 TaxID=3030536 RepID=UPI00263B5F8E|nr:pre-toxin TG domain-containing protein [Paenibacillus sp. PsM32]MDN4621049.1 pre-toxin TG domain-containing protein [Paenibacillus sp. PsM32]
MFKTVGSFLADAVPGLGTLKGLQEIFAGVNYIIGEQLSVGDCVANGVGSLTGFIPIHGAKYVGKYGTEVAIDAGSWVVKQFGKNETKQVTSNYQLKMDLQLFAKESSNIEKGIGIVQYRINIAKGRTRFTPLRPSSNQPVSAGWNHVVDGHFNVPLSNSRSVFLISENKLKNILQSVDSVTSPVKFVEGGQYVRTVDTGEIVANTALKFGGYQTSWIKIFTDQAGNLITVYPVPGPK